MSKVRRKPAPTFPYSPRYPIPDPADPFVPLKVLRERASSNNATLNFSSDNSSFGNGTLDRDGFYLTVNSDEHGQGLDIAYPPSSTDHHEPLTPPSVWPERLGGYYSDNIPAKRQRPPRSRPKPSRESRTYFSDADLPASSPNQFLQDQHPRHREKPVEPQVLQYRRRSKSAFLAPPPSQNHSQGQREELSAAGFTASQSNVDLPRSVHSEVEEVQPPPPPPPEPKPDVMQTRQYTYDDRQSHGYLIGAPSSDFDIHEPLPTDAQSHSQSLRSTTPPMTPDDTLSLSSSSARDRSASLSPRSLSVFRDLPRVTSRPVLDTSFSVLEDRKGAVELDQETPTTAPLHSKDFPLLRVTSAPPSPEASPTVVASAPSYVPEESYPASEPEPESRPRRGRAESASKRHTIHHRVRKTSSISSARWRKQSYPGHRPATRKQSTESESSLSAALAAVQALVESPTSETPERADANAAPAVSSGPSSFPAALVHAQGTTRPLQPQAKRASIVPPADNAGTESDPGPGSRTTRFILHKPKKSLSHVSLVLAGLPNVSMGPTIAPSANTSIGSAMTVGGGFGSVGSLSREDLNRHTQEFALLRPPPTAHPQFLVRSQAVSHSQAVPHSQLVGHPQPIVDRQPVRESEKLKPPERSARRLSSFPILDDDGVPAELKRDLEDSSPIETSTPAFEAMARVARPHTPIPMTPITSRAPSAAGMHSESQTHAAQREPTPPPVQTFTSPLPPIPTHIHHEAAPEPVRPSYYQSALAPPRGPSPGSYVSPTPPSEVAAPAPLPMSPPQPSEPPTPLPLPTPRVKSPMPPPPSLPREVQSAVPNVLRNEAMQSRDESPEQPLPPLAQSPPVERRLRKRETMREEERQSAYLPVAQLRPQAHAQVQTREQEPEPAAQTLARKRISTAQISGPVRQPTPPSQAQHRSRSTFLAPQPHHRSQTPPIDGHYRSRTSTVPAPPRSQSPPPVPEFRAQSPPPAMAHSRVRSPTAYTQARAQSPPPRVPSRARSPTSSQDHGIRHGRSQEQSFFQLTRAGTSRSGGTHSSSHNTRRRETAPSTPVPQYTSPSPSTTYSQPQPAPRAERRSRSQAPTSHRVQRHQQRPQTPVANLRFDEYAIPTREQLKHAASLPVVAQNGIRVQFGELFKSRRTVICFLRHFWCPADQDYMYSVAREVDPEALRHAGLDLVFVGLGSPAMIKSYKQIWRMPFLIYTDPTLRLHAALGMTRRTQDAGSEFERGEYARHGPLGGLAMVVRNAIRVGMPVWEKGGDVTQLGGEFVLGPGPTCLYTHRMRTTRSHAPILHVLSAAGLSTGLRGASPSLAPNDEEQWMEERRRSYARMQARREKRREGGEQWRREDSTDMAYGSDTGSASVSGCWGTNMPREDAPAGTDVGAGRGDGERKRPARSFHIANPDPHTHRYLPPTPVDEEHTAGDHGWDADVSDLPYLHGIVRDRAEPYRLTEEVLAYPYGKS
ncbi:hypothetical protein IEO21_02685 [Rhodonia placenta]|uniref:Thioredoxin domain-containing protein n=1 Tax=Rhodonia placenta TaxID=104341 RepID=A0A8H7U4Y4_9APHY|nr:hypothetical protein IEO21_02685 [Postia placenta]